MILLLKSYPYHFVRTILSISFCPYHFVQYHFVRIPFCQYHFVRYHFVRSPPVLFSTSIVPSPDCYVTTLFLQGFHCFIICLLCHHCSVLGFNCSILCLLHLYAISRRFPLFLFFGLMVASLLCYRLQLSRLQFVASLYYLFKLCIASL